MSKIFYLMLYFKCLGNHNSSICDYLFRDSYHNLFVVSKINNGMHFRKKANYFVFGHQIQHQPIANNQKLQWHLIQEKGKVEWLEITLII